MKLVNKLHIEKRDQLCSIEILVSVTLIVQCTYGCDEETNSRCHNEAAVVRKADEFMFLEGMKCSFSRLIT